MQRSWKLKRGYIWDLNALVMENSNIPNSAVRTGILRVAHLRYVLGVIYSNVEPNDKGALELVPELLDRWTSGKASTALLLPGSVGRSESCMVGRGRRS